MDIRLEANQKAYADAPTENGLFDARKRLEVYVVECLRMGLIVMIGCSFLLSDEDVEEALREFGLDGS